MSDLHFDDALNFLIGSLAKLTDPAVPQAQTRFQRAQGSDIWIQFVANEYWSTRGKSVLNLSQDEQEPLVAPFYDAAWALCRRGVLRPGAAIPAGQVGAQIGQRFNAAPFYGDGYSLTAWGREWVRKISSERPAIPHDPTRLTEVLDQFRPRFGDGYAQRAAEAVSDWWSGNYLSACTMAGAAAESILFATAIAKTKDEAKVLSEYRRSSGRRQVTKLVAAGAAPAVGDQFANALGILSYWRDDAGHGIASTIGELEAHEAISRLLRLAQFTSDHWSVLTT
jgi:hypothetical protein